MSVETTTTPDFDTLLKFAVEKIRCTHSVEEAAKMTIAELGVDSLELIELQMEFEDIHGLVLDVDALQANTPFGEIVAGLQSLDA